MRLCLFYHVWFLIRKVIKTNKIQQPSCLGRLSLFRATYNYKITLRLDKNSSLCVCADASAPALEVKARAHETKIDGLGLYSSAYFNSRDINLGCSRVK